MGNPGWGAILALLFVACSSTSTSQLVDPDAGKVCGPGDQRACSCGALAGFEKCNPDGKGYGPCACGTGGTSGGGTGGSSGGAGGGIGGGGAGGVSGGGGSGGISGGGTGGVSGGGGTGGAGGSATGGSAGSGGAAGSDAGSDASLDGAAGSDSGSDGSTDAVGEDAAALDCWASPNPAVLTTLVAPSPVTSSRFGHVVALSGDTLAIGAPELSSGGAVYVYRCSGGALKHEQTVTGVNTGAGDKFGSAIDLDGDTLVVGAYAEDGSTKGVGGSDDNGAPDSGAAYVFRRSGSTWTQEAYVKASNAEQSDGFGIAVAISSDTLAVGAYLEDSEAVGVGGSQTGTAAANSGAAYVFVRAGTTWSQQAYVKASNTGADDWFGAALDIDGDTLAVGAYREDSAAAGPGGNQNDNTLSASGAVYVYRRSGAAWAQEEYLKASNPGSDDRFGQALSLSGDSLAIGGYAEDSSSVGIGGNQSNNAATDSGAVYVMLRTGTTWSQQAYIKASNTGVDDWFGLRVALDGDALAVGAIQEDGIGTGIGAAPNDGSANTGAAYVFSRSGGVWSQKAYVKPPAAAAGDTFGSGLAISGSRLVVGAPLNDGASADGGSPDFGAAFAYALTGLVP
ncbi:MAG: FG-GAP repeat protein [Myxococcales bacterium]|nr:FG-GAP repeat protein [Myxococcales bacterium]